MKRNPIHTRAQAHAHLIASCLPVTLRSRLVIHRGLSFPFPLGPGFILGILFRLLAHDVLKL